ncbi:carboxylesterase/lipase family protein [Actinomadura nitritigenes]|uniref:Carboxylic ester hydrolase n=1 Tax=Actinomadura nitritigenes TaxID=134602 RepID=A0ABS3QVE6_9ACTN|nr:carboxylesterase/lipase family protein [Actinomadura nitritigenes]MBO2437795.1 carboxylesterase family protein [Actinomadura nitritigenes]
MKPFRRRPRGSTLSASALFVLLAAMVISPAPASAAPPGQGPVVRVAGGAVRGKADATGETFLGIPYAAPPTGALRFRPPAPPRAWSGVRDATEQGPLCPQSVPLGSTSEDCLSLNVYVPPGAAHRKLPVMVWIHGGAYILGSGAGYDPAPLVATGQVIVVSMNYRLGPLGFMALPGLSGESATTGNYGLLDQQAALRWVRANIGAFGGDSRNVTVFGESAGGHSVCMQLISPTARGLFDKAISESGGCVGTPLGPRPLAKAYRTGQAFADSLGCTDPRTVVACLRGLPANKLVGDFGGLFRLDDPGWEPVIDGSVVTEDPASAIKAGRYQKVPLIVGSNKDEGRLFTALGYHVQQLRRAKADDLDRVIDLRTPAAAGAMRAAYPPASAGDADLALSAYTTDGLFACPAHFIAQAAASSGSQPVYQYEFADPKPPLSDFDPLMPLGDYHSSELFYLFRTVQSLPPLPGLNAAQQRLSQQMLSYWTTFAKTGAPNGSGTPTWPAVTPGRPPIQRLTSQGTGPFTTFTRDHHCDLWAGATG